MTVANGFVRQVPAVINLSEVSRTQCVDSGREGAEALKDPSIYVRNAAAWALGEIGTKEVHQGVRDKPDDLLAGLDAFYSIIDSNGLVWIQAQ